MSKRIQMPPIYPLPNNWTWVELGGLTKIISGYPFNSQLFSDLYTDGRPLVRIRDVVRGYTETFTPEDCPEQNIVHKNDILIGMDGDFNVGKWQSEDALLNQRVCFIQSTSELLLNDYLFYFLPRPLKQINDVTPSVTVKHLSIKTIEAIMIPLPPIDEQRRIIVLIESLFSKLDEAKEKAQEVVDGFEARKAAILHKAFSGELTATWRKQRMVDIECWEAKLWGELIQRIEAGKNWKCEERPPYYNEFGVVKVSAVTWGEFNELESKTCTEPEQWNEKTQIRTGDFLFSRANTLQLVGNCVIVAEIERRLMLSDKILRLSFNDLVEPYYVLYFTRSDFYRQQVENLASGNQESMRNISQSNMRMIEIPLPSIPEQQEIIKILDSLFRKEQQIKETAEETIIRIDMIKKSILSRAFRGELGTNDPTDESVELLKQTI